MEDIQNYDQELQGKEPKKSQQDTENNEIVLHSEEKKQNSVTDIFERMVGKDLNIPSYRHYTFLKKYFSLLERMNAVYQELVASMEETISLLKKKCTIQENLITAQGEKISCYESIYEALCPMVSKKDLIVSGINPNLLAKLQKSGQLPPIKKGRQVYYKNVDVKKALYSDERSIDTK